MYNKACIQNSFSYDFEKRSYYFCQVFIFKVCSVLSRWCVPPVYLCIQTLPLLFIFARSSCYVCVQTLFPLSVTSFCELFCLGFLPIPRLLFFFLRIFPGFQPLLNSGLNSQILLLHLGQSRSGFKFYGPHFTKRSWTWPISLHQRYLPLRVHQDFLRCFSWSHLDF